MSPQNFPRKLLDHKPFGNLRSEERGSPLRAACAYSSNQLLQQQIRQSREIAELESAVKIFQLEIIYFTYTCCECERFHSIQDTLSQCKNKSIFRCSRCDSWNSNMTFTRTCITYPIHSRSSTSRGCRHFPLCVSLDSVFLDSPGTEYPTEWW